MFSTPEIKALERLQIQDGVLIDAEKWIKAHDYHRYRQNIHYQSLNQPGIVCGLGVCLAPAPLDISSLYNDGRWVQIQPGIAIDVFGNPIIVCEPIDFHIAANTINTEARLIYIVLSYVDPDKLTRQQVREFEKETFRIDEKTTPPEAFEVELCRIILQPGLVPLENPANVFFPNINSLDFRNRRIAQSRPTAVVRVAHLQINNENISNSYSNLCYLLQASKINPALQGFEQIDKLNFPFQSCPTTCYDLLFTTGKQPIQLSESELTNLKAYLDTGGVLLVESPTDAVDRLESIMNITDALGTPLEDMRQLPRNHPMRTQPFLFAGLPRDIQGKPIQILIAGGIVLVIGELSPGWGLDDMSRPRETIRTAQELGMNLLNFAYSRKQMTQLLQKPVTTQTQTQQPLQAIFNKLEM